MAIFVSSRKNTLPSCPAPFVVNSSCSSSRAEEEFQGDMADANAGLCMAEIVSHGKLMTDELVRQVSRGVNVHLGICSVHLGASGTMQKSDDAFCPEDSTNDHELHIYLRVNREFEKRVIAAAVVDRKGKGDVNIPLVRSAASVRAHEPSACAAGQLVRVEGDRLYFDETDPSLGLFFIVGAAEIRADYYVMVKSSMVIAEVPSGVPAGKCAIVVRGFCDDINVREGRLQAWFTVL
ncbi:MAG: hypothetical protein CVV47_04595 [Spirochaetae bacterium HGW-Spirochaetae-3]|nr:MAG: hypothetical protein CVV47_04595 [Spirochaetae bacterium HGW-Spirochaetae-3]